MFFSQVGFFLVFKFEKLYSSFVMKTKYFVLTSLFLSLLLSSFLSEGSCLKSFIKESAPGLFTQAYLARQNAHAPYSNFLVGVAISTSNDDVYVGANVENMALKVIHAEESAIANMISQGGIKIKEITVVGDCKNGLCTPCGNCRQLILEFAESEKTPVHIYDHVEGYQKTYEIGQLLPDAFKL